MQSNGRVAAASQQCRAVTGALSALEEASPKTHQKKCDRWVSHTASSDIFAVSGITHAHRLNLRNLPSGLNRGLMDELKATHLVEVKYRLRKDKRRIEFEHQLLDLRAARIVKRHFLSKEIQTPLPEGFMKGLAKDGFFARFTRNLLPNSLALGFMRNHMLNRKYDQWDEETYKHNSALPEFISSISLLNLPHPHQFDQIDWDANLYFNAIILSADTKYTYRNLDESGSVTEEQTYDLKLLGGGPMANADFSFFLYGFRLFFEIGYGPGYASVEDSLGFKDAAFVHMNKVMFGFDVFLNTNIFLRFNGGAIYLNPPLIKNEIFELMGSYQFMVGLGYCFGSVDF